MQGGLFQQRCEEGVSRPDPAKQGDGLLIPEDAAGEQLTQAEHWIAFQPRSPCLQGEGHVVHGGLKPAES